MPLRAFRETPDRGPGRRPPRRAARPGPGPGPGALAIAAPPRAARYWRTATWASSVVLRVCCFIFLRWIPGHHFPLVILSSLGVYVVGFWFTGAFARRRLEEGDRLVVNHSNHTNHVDFSSRTSPISSQASLADRPRAQADSISDRYAAAYSRILEKRQLYDEQEFRGGATSTSSSIYEDSPSRRKELPGAKRAMHRSMHSLSSSVHSTASHGRAHTPPGVRLASDASVAGVTETLLSGLPNPASWLWSTVTALINVALVVMVADAIFRAPLLHSSPALAFGRVGFIDERSARVLVREPDAAQLPLTLQYKTASAKRWSTAGTTKVLDESTDYTHAFTVSGLRPETQYEWAASNGRNGSFVTAPPTGHAWLSFVTSSCIKARVPYAPWDHPLRIPGLETLSAVAPRVKARFMLFLGDFIYVDVPWRMGYGRDTYRREYRQVYASPSWSGAAAALPWLHAIDDHEIANDWDKKLAAPFPAALDPFAHYHAAANAPAVVPNTTAFTFRHGPASFFVLDTRRHRDPSAANSPTNEDKTMLGAAQLETLLLFLAQKEPPGVLWKIVASSVPFTRNWRANALDTWAGYLAERQIILEAMWDAAAKGYGVVVLSGDRHEFAATRFPAPDALGDEQPGRDKKATPLAQRWCHPVSRRPVAVYEFSCSPLSMFYLPLRTYRDDGQSSHVGAGGKDEKLVYLPDGNVKIGAVAIGPSPRGSTLRYRLFVNGEERWAYGVAHDGSEGEDIGREVENLEDWEIVG